jgi:hypothetical protein
MFGTHVCGTENRQIFTPDKIVWGKDVRRTSLG